MSEYRILIVDDEENLRRAIRYGLSGRRFSVLEAASGRQALEVLEKEQVDLIVSDLKMPEMDGLSLLSACHEKHFQIPFIILTAFGTVETAVEAMRSGAIDFLIKPFPLTELEQKISGVLMAQSGALKVNPAIEDFIGESLETKTLLSLCGKFARAPSPVLLTGESGTGKEITAKLIHKLSGRTGKFLAVNCGALPENLLESELFGFRKGAFTGAMRDHQGFFVEAEDGTLLLDEIGEISPRMQVALLRVIQEHEFHPLGSAKNLKSNARVITSTNRNLEQMTKEGRFREDLYYRLKVLEIVIPPLRKRRSDVMPLAEYFLNSFSVNSGKNVRKFSDSALSALQTYSFPGNVRELKNMVERAVWLCEEGEIGLQDLGLSGTEGRLEDDNRLEFKDRVESYERNLIRDAIVKFGNNKTQLSEKLGLNRTALLYKLKKYGLLQED
ncbi:MAG: sigma-54 dependent transcriptional regulator [Candidatus Wallbacteria bacterium]|nr:sigma-54 dependent transcriptional regulator [Candidatus Wallbacteria bacterium]